MLPSERRVAVAELADVKERFGAEGSTADLLHLLCGGKPQPGNVQSCTRTLGAPITIHGVAGHMHLLGRSIRIEVDPGTPRARTILDIPVWDFDDQGSRIVMQVHYNLLAGQQPDTSAAQLRLAPGKRPYQALSTMLLPAPVELPCRPQHSDGELCDRDAALADVKQRFGAEGNTADLLYFLCGGKSRPGRTQSCLRTLSEPITIHGVAGHMPLLGRTITVEGRPGTPQAQTILDIPVWDFDDQGSRPVEPITLQPFEQVKVTCTHVQWLRDKLPSFEGQPDRYVVWGEGTTDEMCLGMLQVTRP